MEHESLEVKIVMADGSDAEVLGRVRDLELGFAVYTAAVYPNRNIQLRQGVRVIRKHEGEPKPQPAAPIDPNLKSWSVHLIRGKSWCTAGSFRRLMKRPRQMQPLRSSI